MEDDVKYLKEIGFVERQQTFHKAEFNYEIANKSFISIVIRSNRFYFGTNNRSEEEVDVWTLYFAAGKVFMDSRSCVIRVGHLRQDMSVKIIEYYKGVVLDTESLVKNIEQFSLFVSKFEQ